MEQAHLNPLGISTLTWAAGTRTFNLELLIVKIIKNLECHSSVFLFDAFLRTRIQQSLIMDLVRHRFYQAEIENELFFEPARVTEFCTCILPFFYQWMKSENFKPSGTRNLETIMRIDNSWNFRLKLSRALEEFECKANFKVAYYSFQKTKITFLKL